MKQYQEQEPKCSDRRRTGTIRLDGPSEPWFLKSRVRLYTVLSLLLALPAILIAILVASDIRSQVLSQRRDRLDLIAKLSAQSIDEQFNGLVRYSLSYADRPLLVIHCANRDTAGAFDVLSQFVTSNPVFSRAFIADTTGTIWVDSPHDPAITGLSFARRDWYRGIMSGRVAYVSEMYKRQALGQPYVVAITSRINHPQLGFVGILVGQATLSDLVAWFLDTELPEGGHIALVDHTGKWVDNATGKIHASEEHTASPFDMLSSGQPLTLAGDDPVTGEPALIAAAPVPTTGWTVVVRQPLDQVLAPVGSSRRSLFIYCAVSVLIVTVIVGSMYRTLRRYDTERREREEELRIAYRDIEGQVRTRTSQLTAANTELRRLAAIVASTSDAIGSANLSGIMTSWNKAAEELYGWTREEMIGQSCDIMLPEGRNHETAETMRKVVAGERVPPFETVRLRKDGSTFHVSLAYSPILDESGLITGVSVVARDITHQKLMEAEAQRLEQERQRLLDRLQMTLDRMPIGCILHDTEFRFTYWNPAAERIFGYRFEEVKGRHPIGIIAPESSQQSVSSVLARLAADGREVDAVGENITKDGRRITCIWNNSSLRDADGKFLGVISMCQDVTDKKRSEERLRRYTEMLAQNNRELQDFAFVASHDLQEPLRKIIAFGRRLEDACAAQMSEEAKDYLARMQRAAMRMQTLINDLLDFSRVTTRAQPFTSTNLNDVATEVLSDLEARIEQTGGRVEIGELPTIEADRVQMRQLLQNLIANALKFHSPDAAPQVRVDATVLPPPEGAANSHGVCQMTVTDNGIGFDQKFADRIFTPFQRLHGRHEYEGTGMGLAICRKIAERHGGTIAVISAPGQGSTFIVTIPVGQQEAGSREWTPNSDPSASSWPTTTQTTAS